MLIAAQSQYTDNSRLFYQFGNAEAQLKDLEQLKERPELSLEQVLEDKQEQFAQELNNKTFLYSLLKEKDKKDLLLDLSAYALLGRRRVKLPYYGENNIRLRNDLVARHEQAALADPELLEAVRKKWFTDLFSLFQYTHNGFDFKLYTISEELFRHKHNPSYTVTGESLNVAVSEGDIVLDCGAAFGDVSLQFAEKIGESGHVYCYEPYHLFLKVYEQNMLMNPELAARTTLIDKGVWHVDGETLSFTEEAGNSRIDEGSHSSFKITTTTIDETASKLNLSRVDFIKMDIEGAELNALRGAVNTLKEFRPKLAISLYHNPEDFYTIPFFLNSLYLGYEFSINHHDTNEWETVLYAKVKN
nr:FkbM family methyltransferase [Desulfovibrio sp. JC010]